MAVENVLDRRLSNHRFLGIDNFDIDLPYVWLKDVKKSKGDKPEMQKSDEIEGEQRKYHDLLAELKNNILKNSIRMEIVKDFNEVKSIVCKVKSIDEVERDSKKGYIEVSFDEYNEIIKTISNKVKRLKYIDQYYYNLAITLKDNQVSKIHFGSITNSKIKKFIHWYYGEKDIKEDDEIEVPRIIVDKIKNNRIKHEKDKYRVSIDLLRDVNVKYLIDKTKTIEEIKKNNNLNRENEIIISEDIVNNIIAYLNLKYNFIVKVKNELKECFEKSKIITINSQVLKIDKIKEILVGKDFEVNEELTKHKIEVDYIKINSLLIYYQEKREQNTEAPDNIKEILYDYTNNDLEALTTSIKRIITKNINDYTDAKSEYYSTLFFQYVGNNIRKSGKAFHYSEEYDFKAYTSIAKRINCLIKIYRYYYTNVAKDEERMDGRVNIVIDSLKNIYESEYLNSRYTNYYLVAVNKDEADRKKDRKKVKNMTDPYSVICDINENPSFIKDFMSHNNYIQDGELKDKLECHFENVSKDDKRIFYWQDVESCIQHADILIEAKTKKHSYMAIKMFRYIMLMMHPGLVMPTNIERCMQVAFAAKVSSGCASRQVGATITDENYNIKSIGWNDAPDGQVPCNYRCLDDLRNNCAYSVYSKFEAHDEKFREYYEDKYDDEVEGNIDDVKEKLDGCKYLYCFKDLYNQFTDRHNAAMTRSLHAEERAFLELSRSGSDRVENGYLFTTSSSCELCTKKAYHMGIKTIYYIESYPGISENHIAMSGPPETRPNFQLFSGAIGVAYSKLYTPILPRKDEIELKIGYRFGEKDEDKGRDTDRGKKEGSTASNHK